MDIATKILVLGGVTALLWAFVLGFFFAQERAKAAQAPRYLVMAHVGGLMGGTMLLALTVAFRAAALSAGLETVCAALIAGGTVALVAKDTLNWSQGVTDEFKSQPPLQSKVGVAAVLAMSLGLAIVAVGVLSAVLA
jgi:hypothetical protein